MRLALLAATLLTTLASAASWPQFRGPNGSGVDDGAGYPVAFSPTKNLAWKQEIPYSQSSPVIFDGRVYLTASDGSARLTLCFDAATGRELWRRSIEAPRTAEVYRANDPASPSPTADGDGVVVFFPDVGLAAYSPSGQQLWTLPLGPFKNFYGMAGSPILAGELVVLVCDQQAGSFVLAAERKSGRIRWNTPRTGAGIGWATPIVFQPSEGPTQLVILGSTRLDGYSLATGERRWWIPIGSFGAIGTPLASGDTVLISTRGSTEPFMPRFEPVLEKYDKDRDGRLSKDEFGGDPDLGEHFGWIDIDSDGLVTAAEWNETRTTGTGDFGALAVRPGSSEGELPAKAVLWRFKRNLPYIPSPLLYQGVLYLVRDGGVITSLDPAMGQLLRQGRSDGALGEYYASPVAADGRVYIASTEGKVSVIKAGGEWEVLAVNDLKDEIHATPALNAGRIYIRTRGALYCFGSPAR